MMGRPSQRQRDHQSNVFLELSSLVLSIIRSPPTVSELSDQSAVLQRRPAPRRAMQQITPAGFASLLLGISLALMLCGSVTFFIGFILMPWVIGLVMFLYFVGVVSSLSTIGRAILCCGSADPSSPKDDSWLLIKVLEGVVWVVKFGVRSSSIVHKTTSKQVLCETSCSTFNHRSARVLKKFMAVCYMSSWKLL